MIFKMCISPKPVKTYVSYGEFCYIYTNSIQKLIILCQNHGVILKEKLCPTCGEQCRIDWNKLCFRCDKSYVTSGRRRKKCAFKKTIYKGTWFENVKLDVETNLKFVLLFVQDWFSYKVATSELKLSNVTINDWCSFCREVLISWVLRHTRKIGGPNQTVEIDESKFGKRKYNVGRVIEGQWVFGAICRESMDFLWFLLRHVTVIL